MLVLCQGKEPALALGGYLAVLSPLPKQLGPLEATKAQCNQ
jgi:hypothetical protein